MGTEFDRLRDFAGGDKRSLELYQSFRDPQSFPRRDLQEFPFMAVGPVSHPGVQRQTSFLHRFHRPQRIYPGEPPSRGASSPLKLSRRRARARSPKAGRRRMRIAVIGWGSLMWFPGQLGIKNWWHSDGPKLPIEFGQPHFRRPASAGGGSEAFSFPNAFSCIR